MYNRRVLVFPEAVLLPLGVVQLSSLQSTANFHLRANSKSLGPTSDKITRKIILIFIYSIRTNPEKRQGPLYFYLLIVTFSGSTVNLFQASSNKYI